MLEGSAAGRDLIVSAQTGSGKTVAYGLAIASTLLSGAERFSPHAMPLALIVAPTRELALQVERELTWLYEHTGAAIMSCVGGMDPKRERRRLAEGAHIVVGTPGRLRDHLERGALDITALRAVVLDEADEMLDLGFREDLEFILEATPATRRTLMFSATMPRPIAALAKKYQRDALRIEATSGERGHADIEYRAIRVAANEIEHAVVNVLRFVDPASAIVFCNTRDHVRHLHATLSERGFAAVNLSGELSQSERNHALQALRDGRARVCVATDVAARGIDLPNLGLVIHADLPSDSEALQHRSGRTGRAGKKGISVVLVPLARRRKAERLLAEVGSTPVWSGPPQPEDIHKLDQQRLLQDPLLAETPAEEDMMMAREVMATRSPEEIAAALVRLYRARLPAAEEVFDPGPARNFSGPKPPRREAPRSDDQAYTWFRLAIGRKNNADPKWLVPMLCRRGKVTKAEIGAIRISDHETRFEIADASLPRFMAAIAADDGGNDGQIELFGGTPPEKSQPDLAPRDRDTGRPHAPRKPFAPGGKRKFKPFEKPAAPDRPAAEGSEQPGVRKPKKAAWKKKKR